MTSTELQARNLRAIRYHNKCARKWAQNQNRFDRLIAGFFWFSITLFLWAASLAWVAVAAAAR